LNTSSTLSPFVGYEICQSSPKIYSFSGNLISDDFSQTNLAYTSSALYPGQHIFANPYTAAIDIRMLDTAFGNNIEQAVYLYNSGSFSEWENNNGEITHDSLTTTPGQYTVSTPFTAGVGGVPSQIPSMQAFLVKAKSNDLSNSHLSFNYSSVLVKNSERQRAQRQKVGVSDEQMLMRIEVLAEKTSDQMWFFVDQSRSRKFDNGWDGRKLLGSSLSPQLYAMEDDGFYQIDALNDLNNCEIGFKRGVDTEYTLKITHNNLNKMYSNIYLQDLVENKVVDVTQSGVEFKFSAQSNPTITKRFKLLVRYHEKNANGEPVFLKAFSSDKSIYVQNAANVGGEAIVYDLFGHYINKYSVTSNSISKLPVILSSGVYLVKTLCATEIFTQRITVR
jgi:hypothetical protein